jgi:hypothetical protein
MVLQSPPGSEQAITESADICYDRRKHLTSALNELKGRISRVEQQHPYLRDDLSAICDKAILSLQSNPSLQDTAAATETINDPSPITKINPLSLALDKTGACIMNGLDLMGDGIIFLLLKISKALD